ncbi:MAG: DNA translocase FtsK [Planctomycetes bacterium]|nr:DNA translocase FtsK [Planctomycetota bacterium]
MGILLRGVAWLCFGLAVYLGLAFASYDPLEGVTAVARISNLGGVPGRLLSFVFVEGFGVGAYLLCFHAMLSGLELLKTGVSAQKPLRLLGLFLAMFSFGALWQGLLQHHAFPGGNVPLGGVLGDTGFAFLASVMGRGWSFVFLTCALAGSVLLAADGALALLNAKPSKRSKKPAQGPVALFFERCAAPFTALFARFRRSSPQAALATAGGTSVAEADAETDELESDEAEPVRKGRKRAAVNSAPEAEPIKPAPAVLDADAVVDDEPLQPRSGPVPVRNNTATAPARRADAIEFIRLASGRTGKEPYALPPVTLLTAHKTGGSNESDEELREKASALEQALLNFRIEAQVTEIVRGPVVTRFDVKVKPGTRIAQVVGVSDDVAMNLGVLKVRIAPVQDRKVLGIEIPNKNRAMVCLREVIEAIDHTKRKPRIPIYLGKDASGNPHVEDITTMPHMLIGGRTGAGKSVFINNLVLSILLTRYPEEVRLVMVDPKKVELAPYHDIPHLFVPVATDPKKATKVLEWLVVQMEQRYEMLEACKVRKIEGYNDLTKKARQDLLSARYSPDELARIPEKMPYLVIIVDELADLMQATGKEVESAICRIAQKARAVGMHLVVATQRPSVDVVTGLIRSNLPARVAFQTKTGIDSRTILDSIGAETLLDRGDMLFGSATAEGIRRFQTPFVSDEEVEHVVEYLRKYASPNYTSAVEQVAAVAPGLSDAHADEGFMDALDAVMSSGQASASMIQTRCSMGYARARRMVELMEQAGYVGPARGAKPREILLLPEKYDEIRSAAGGSSRSASK